MISKNLSTTPTIALFVIISVTGVLLLGHIGGTNLKSIHEWLGLAFVVFALLHGAANWSCMRRYLNGSKALVITAMLVGALAFSLVPTAEKGANPVRTTFSQAVRAPISTLALLYGISEQSILEQLHLEGYDASSSGVTPQELGSRYGVPAEKVLALIAANVGR